MKFKQVRLGCLELQPAALVCWVDMPISKGQKIELKDCPEILWLVEEVYETELDPNDIYRPWKVSYARK